MRFSSVIVHQAHSTLGNPISIVPIPPHLLRMLFRPIHCQRTDYWQRNATEDVNASTLAHVLHLHVTVSFKQCTLKNRPGEAPRYCVAEPLFTVLFFKSRDLLTVIMNPIAIACLSCDFSTLASASLPPKISRIALSMHVCIG